MKCLQVSGNERSVEDFVSGMIENLEPIPLFILRKYHGGIVLERPGVEDPAATLLSMPPAIVVAAGFTSLAAPVVWCASDPPPPEVEPLVIRHCTGKILPGDYHGIFHRTFDLLPQKSRGECGRCGMDCRKLAAAVLAGLKDPGDCFYAPGGNVEVIQDGRKLALGGFPAQMLEGTLRGLLSTFKGFSRSSPVTIRMTAEKPEKDRP